MTKKPFQEQLSKFSLLGELPKAENGLEEAWGNLKKCTEPFTAQDIIKQQQETINRQQAEIKRLEHIKDTIAVIAIKEFAERLKEKLIEESYDDCQFFKVVGESEIDNLVIEMVGDNK